MTCYGSSWCPWWCCLPPPSPVPLWWVIYKASTPVQTNSLWFLHHRPRAPKPIRKRIGLDLSKENQFCSFFGASATTALQVWNLLNKFHYLPHEAQILHLLWTLFFMKVYPSQNVANATAGVWEGAIDPKTLCKYLWPMIEAIANLEQHVVSR